MAITKVTTPGLIDLPTTISSVETNTDGVVLAKGSTSATASIDYLVVAGGGGSAGGYQSAGGGGGGLRTSYPGGSGGGGASETALLLSSGVNYTVTIGVGGAAGIAISAVQGSANKGGNGGDSSISGSNITTFTSDGGGGGASYWNTPIPNNIGNIGGSGGGAGPFTSSIGSNTRAAGTPNQGYAGGGAVGYGPPYMGGGGGGAGGVGADASGNTLIGNGGVGLQVDIDGNNNYYAGGGGGSGWASASFGAGGNGGGGDGGTSQGLSPQPGTANTGGGGGGESDTTTVGQAGGSGIIILRYSNIFTATYTAGTGGVAGTETAIGTSDKYIKITAGTGTIAFSGIPTTSARPTTNLNIGEFRYNTTDKKVEYYDGAGWFTLTSTTAVPQAGTTGVCNYPTTAVALYQFESNGSDTCNNWDSTSEPGITYFTPGKFGYAANFTQTTSGVYLPKITTLTNDISVSGWLKLGSTTTTNGLRFIEINATTVGYAGVLAVFYAPSNGEWKVRVGDGSSSETDVLIHIYTLTQAVWYNVCVTRDDSSNVTKLYINGSEVDSETVSATPTVQASAISVIGQYVGSSTGYGWLGDMDQIRLFSSVLTSDQVTALYQETAP